MLGNTRTRGKLPVRVSHRSLDAPRTRAHRLHRPSSSVLINNEHRLENGRRDVAEVAPDQAKTSGSLRAIFDSELGPSALRPLLVPDPVLDVAPAARALVPIARFQGVSGLAINE